MSQTIKFIPSSKDVVDWVPPPKPAKNYIPKWYKEIPPYDGGKPEFAEGFLKSGNPPVCMPFTDTLLTGYIQESWAEIHIGRDDNGGRTFNYSVGPQHLLIRGPNKVPTTSSYEEIDFVWTQPWIPKTPKGYSVLLTHPLNRMDLPFRTLSGIMDSDNFYHTPFGKTPFQLEKDFEGIIPVGTPMFQYIPIKRDNWKSERCKWDEDKSVYMEKTVRKHLLGGYRKLFHVKKNFR